MLVLCCLSAGGLGSSGKADSQGWDNWLQLPGAAGQAPRAENVCKSIINCL